MSKRTKQWKIIGKYLRDEDDCNFATITIAKEEPRRALIEAAPAMKDAVDATHRYFLAVTAEAIATDPNAQTVSGVGLDELAEDAAEKVHRAVEKLGGRLTAQIEGQDEVDAQVELRRINAELLAALEEIESHDPNKCNGITPRDCLDSIREIARAAIARAKGGA